MLHLSLQKPVAPLQLEDSSLMMIFLLELLATAMR